MKYFSINKPNKPRKYFSKRRGGCERKIQRESNFHFRGRNLDGSDPVRP